MGLWLFFPSPSYIFSPTPAHPCYPYLSTFVEGTAELLSRGRRELKNLRDDRPRYRESRRRRHCLPVELKMRMKRRGQLALLASRPRKNEAISRPTTLMYRLLNDLRRRPPLEKDSPSCIGYGWSNFFNRSSSRGPRLIVCPPEERSTEGFLREVGRIES